MKRTPLIILSVLLGVLGTIFIFALTAKAKHNQLSALPEYFNVPKFSYSAANGSQFGNKEMVGKVIVLDFIFTSCKGPCPVMSAKMKRLYELFSEEPDVQLVSVSVDPERDSQSVLREYAKRLGVTDSRWIFLREDNLDRVAGFIEDGFKLASDGLPFSHPVQFILIDQVGKIRGYYDGTNSTDIDSLTVHIKCLLQNES